jgi:hypothetical protein
MSAFGVRADTITAEGRRLGGSVLLSRPAAGLTMAHTVFAIAMALGYLAFSLPAAGADAAAWCAVIKGGEYWDCQYRSLEDCWPNVLGGNRGWCSPNPYVVAMPTESKGSRKRRAPPQ